MVADEQDVDTVRVCAVFGKESREHDKVVELEPLKVVHLDEPYLVDGEDYNASKCNLLEVQESVVEHPLNMQGLLYLHYAYYVMTHWLMLFVFDPHMGNPKKHQPMGHHIICVVQVQEALHI
jgi:hypothetical protein